MTKSEILNRICRIEIELSSLYYENKKGTLDPLGNKKSNLSQEWVYLSRLYKETKE